MFQFQDTLWGFYWISFSACFILLFVSVIVSGWKIFFFLVIPIFIVLCLTNRLCLVRFLSLVLFYLLVNGFIGQREYRNNNGNQKNKPVGICRRTRLLGWPLKNRELLFWFTEFPPFQWNWIRYYLYRIDGRSHFMGWCLVRVILSTRSIFIESWVGWPATASETTREQVAIESEEKKNSITLPSFAAFLSDRRNSSSKIESHSFARKGTRRWFFSRWSVIGLCINWGLIYRPLGSSASDDARATRIERGASPSQKRNVPGNEKERKGTETSGPKARAKRMRPRQLSSIGPLLIRANASLRFR